MGAAEHTRGMPKPIDVSVVIPAFNAEATIGRAVESVLSQERVHPEVIVVDDGSKDGTSDMVLRIAGREGGHPIRLLHHAGRVNRGVGASRNVGIAQTQAPFVAFLDADDWLLPGSLISRLEVIRDRPELAFVYGRVQRHDATELQGNFTGSGMPGEPFAMLVWLLFENPIFTSTLMVRRSGLPEPPFPERFPAGMAVGEDWLAFLAISRRGPAFFLSRDLAAYHQSPAAYSKALCDRGVRHAQLCAEAEIVRSFAKRPDPMLRHVKEALAYRSAILLVEAGGQLARIQPATARACLVSALRIAGTPDILFRAATFWMPRIKLRAWFPRRRSDGPAWKRFIAS